MDDYYLPSRSELLERLLSCLTDEDKQLLLNGKKIIDEERVEDYYAVLKYVQENTIGNNLSIHSKLFSPFPDSAFISISGDNFVLNNLKEIQNVSKSISNIEFMPLVEGVSMVITFNGLKYRVLDNE